jgi:hypothetical protein
VIPKDVTPLVRQVFVNVCPLFTRLAHVPVERVDFLVDSTLGITPASRRRRTQYCATFQMPVSRATSDKQAGFPGGIESPYEFNQTLQLQNLVSDIENSLFYSVAEPPIKDSAGRWLPARMDGLFSLIETNNVRTPLNSGGYTVHDFVRDIAKSPFDLLFISSDFFLAFAEWGIAAYHVGAKTVFGTPIAAYEVPFLSGVRVIPAPRMRPKSAVALRLEDVSIRSKEPVQWRPRENDARVSGEWFAEVTIELKNEHHHSAVSGITRFAAS